MLNTDTSNEAKMSREERIRRRAEELYRLRGNAPGSALDDWLRAEREIVLQELTIDGSLEESFPASDALRFPAQSEWGRRQNVKAKN